MRELSAVTARVSAFPGSVSTPEDTPQSAGKTSSVPHFAVVYDEHLAFVWRSVRRLGVPQDLVDDVVQDVFVIVFRRLHTFRELSSIRTWLFGILRRVVRDRRRSYQRVHRVETPWDDGIEEFDPASSFDRLEQHQAGRIVRQLLAKLDDDKREVFILAELEEMTVPEIATATGTNQNTVYSRLRASRKQFEEMLRNWQRAEPRSVP